MTSEEKGGPQKITVTVFSPRSPEPKQFTWLKTMKIGDAADEAAKAFGYEPGGTPPTFIKDGKVLDRNKPFVAEGVKDGDSLELVAGGGGV